MKSGNDVVLLSKIFKYMVQPPMNWIQNSSTFVIQYKKSSWCPADHLGRTTISCCVCRSCIFHVGGRFIGMAYDTTSTMTW